MFLGRIYLLIFAFLAQLGLSGCYTKQSNTACAYTVGTLNIDNGESYSIKSEDACKEICDASSECVALEYIYRGQHSGGPMKLGTGTCYYYGGTEYSTAVDHDRSCFVKTTDCDDECPGEIATDMRCGSEFHDQICSKDYPYCNLGNGWCGNSAAHKAAQTTTKYEYKAGCECPGEIATDMKCGPENNDQICPKDYPYCNSRNGWCGNTAAHKAAQTTTKYEYKAGCARNIAEQALSFNGLAETANPKLIENVTYVFAAIGFLSMLYVGVKRGSKAFCQGDYAEV